MKLIVGLGNPDKQYEKTRHNVGFIAIDYLAKHFKVSVSKNKFNGLYGETIINNEKVIFLKPQKYINLSGDVINNYILFFKIEITDILIIHDDMDTMIGEYKLRYKGGSAGHNGLKNIEINLKTQNYKRIKIGISKNKQVDTVNYVLGKFDSNESEEISKIIKKLPDIIIDFLNLSFDNLMNKYNI